MNKTAENIGTIRQKFQAAALSELPVLLSSYEKDERAGVQAALSQARKRLLAYEKEAARMETLKRYEREYSAYTHICGIDEVGRGPLAGPVVAGAVILPKDCDILYINDSKKLSEKKERGALRGHHGKGCCGGAWLQCTGEDRRDQYFTGYL